MWGNKGKSKVKVADIDQLLNEMDAEMQEIDMTDLLDEKDIVSLASMKKIDAGMKINVGTDIEAWRVGAITFVSFWNSWKPGAELKLIHDGRKIVTIIEGSLKINGEHYVRGDKQRIRPFEEHTMTAGPNGAVFIVEL